MSNMTDITTEDLLRVARGVFGAQRVGIAWCNSIEILHPDEYGHENRELFNPLTSDADAFKVLEALVKKWSKGDGDLSLFSDINDSDMHYVQLVMIDKVQESFRATDLRTAIVKAYLSLIGETK